MLSKLSDYLKASRLELKKVTWPTKKETTKHTLIVIGVTLTVAAVLGILDYAFSFLISLVIK